MSSVAQPDIAATREQAVHALLASTRAQLEDGPLTRERLGVICQHLVRLAEQRALWTDAPYAPPEGGEKQARYLIASEGENGLSLYLNVMQGGKKIPPHDHTTWACIAAVQGSEHNTLYTREDDGSQAGHARLSVREVVEIRPGTPVAMMPDDIHSVEIKGEEIIRHLHFYGRPLETLTERKAFDLENDTYKIMSIGVKTRS